jgi:hypothetical protein
MSRLRRFYGAQPLHLLATVVSFALVAAGFVRWIGPGSDPRGILLWFAGCLIGSSLLVVPLIWLLDLIAFGRAGRARGRGHALRPVRAYIQVPALLSGLLLLVSLPLILRLGESSFEATSGVVPSGYLFRWLYATAALFGGSALLYALKLARQRRAVRRAR